MENKLNYKFGILQDKIDFELLHVVITVELMES